ncbi:hypothetical protein Tco_0713959 [Tanacetum coccineum]
MVRGERRGDRIGGSGREEVGQSRSQEEGVKGGETEEGRQSLKVRGGVVAMEGSERRRRKRRERGGWKEVGE